ncbi:MAG: flavin reductase family protein [Candidatus Edwardsbacteria bacterium]|jgi:flavin reductase (DIM6/NTAB) family NADH-FMN oxidoreductase RutF|nr:flavin reductase family protein [Candidatus Edwardsbacteria bacterium]
MERGLRKIAPAKVDGNVIKLMGDDWFLLTAGNLTSWNTMTAAWGGLGYLWQRPVAFVFVRPQRHTFGFMERNDRFTLCFFDRRHRAALRFCGSRSGRDCDKAKETGLVPRATPGGGVYFAQARLVIECRTIYAQDIDPARFADRRIARAVYPRRDFHRMYIGEIAGCWNRR